jgi:hypothetical protein
MTPSKIIILEDGVIHAEEEKAPKETGSIEKRLKKLEDIVFKYEKAIDKGLDACSLPMNHDLEKKLKTYENRIKYIEDKFL